jgi:hypothetical protein
LKPPETKKAERFDYLNFAADNDSESDAIREKESDYDDDFEEAAASTPHKTAEKERGFTLGRIDKTISSTPALQGAQNESTFGAKPPVAKLGSALNNNPTLLPGDPQVRSSQMNLMSSYEVSEQFEGSPDNNGAVANIFSKDNGLAS